MKFQPNYRVCQGNYIVPSRLQPGTWIIGEIAPNERRHQRPPTSSGSAERERLDINHYRA
jgi:hypothetical protein